MSNADNNRAQVRAHIEKHLGPVSRAFDAPASEASDVSVLFIPEQPTRPVHTLITLGLSDRPMNAPSGKSGPRHIELMMTLPRTWKLDEKSLGDERWYWPMRELFALARKPQVEGSWLGWGEVIPNGEPPQRYAPNTKLAGAVIVPSLLVPQDFYELTIAAQTIAFFCLLPLYREEMDLQKEKGVNSLFETLLDAGVKDFVDPQRKNVGRKKILGLF
jgi:hypothetical protein